MDDKVIVVDESRSSVDLKDGFKAASVNVTVENQIIAEALAEDIDVLELTRIEGPAALGLKTLGWRFWQDAQATDDNPLILPGGVRMQLPVDGQGLLSGAFGTKSDQWLDPITSKFYPDALGDFFIYRVNLTVWPLVNNKTFTVDFDIGTANRVFELPTVLNHGAGYPHKLSLSMPIAVSQGFVQNGGTMNVAYEADARISRISVLALKSYSVTG